MGNAASSLGLFGFVWALFCLLASGLVTDTLLRQAEAMGTAPDSGDDARTRSAD